MFRLTDTSRPGRAGPRAARLRRGRYSLVFLVLLATPVAAACGDGGVESQVLLTVGTTDATAQGFVALPDGSDVDLTPGAQGGFHVWLNLRIQGVRAGTYSMEHAARRQADDTLILREQPQPFEIPVDAIDTYFEPLWAQPAFMCPSPIGVNVIDEPIVFRVLVRDADGQLLAEDPLVLVPRCTQQIDFCISICSG